MSGVSELVHTLSPWLMAYHTTRDIGRGTTNPTTAIGGVQAGDRYFRTDLALALVYDGTRWLTQQEYVVNSALLTFSGNGSQIVAPIRTDYAPYVTRCSVQWLTSASHTGGSYWTYTLRGINAAYSAASSFHQANTSATGASSWNAADAAPSIGPLPSNRAAFDILLSATGTPGNISLLATVSYRLVIP